MRKMHHRRTRAKDFGDNPRIRGGLEHKRTNWAEPWERSYAKRFKRLIKVPGHIRHVGRKRVSVHGYHRRWRRPPHKR